MSLPEQIAELILTIHHFQQKMAPLRQQLFNIPIVTKRLIWNYMVGQIYPKASQSQLHTFLRKHNLKTQSQRSVGLIIDNFSSKKDDNLNLQDLWSIFKPLTIKMTEEIMVVRERKISIAKNAQINYKITDLLCSILQKTIQFLKIAQEMKQNIVKCQAIDIKIQPIDAAHLHMFINKYDPYLILKDADIIFRHIIKNKIICLKSFQEYFIPRSYHGNRYNPNYNHEKQLLQELQGLQLIKYHKQNIYFIKQQRNKKALYLSKGKNTHYM